MPHCEGGGVNSRGSAGDEWALCGPASSYCSSQERTLVRCGSRSLTPVMCSRPLCISGRGLLSPPSLPSFPNCKLIIFFRFTTPSTTAPAELKRASCQTLEWARFIWKSTYTRTLMCVEIQKTLMRHRHELEVNTDVQLGHRLIVFY